MRWLRRICEPDVICSARGTDATMDLPDPLLGIRLRVSIAETAARLPDSDRTAFLSSRAVHAAAPPAESSTRFPGSDRDCHLVTHGTAWRVREGRRAHPLSGESG